MKRYKVWLSIEEFDEKTEKRQNIKKCTIGPDFNRKDDAEALIEEIQKYRIDTQFIQVF